MPGPKRRRITQRSPLARPLGGWATIRARLDDTHYEIQMESRVSMPVIAFYSGARVIEQGERVNAVWRDESRIWYITGVGKPSLLLVSTEPGVGGDDGQWRRDPAAFFNTFQFVQLQGGNAPFEDIAIRGFWRFPNIAVAQGTTISQAVMRFSRISPGADSALPVRISAEDVDNSTAPTSAAEADAAVLTTANVLWTYPTGFPNLAVIDTDNFASVIQEIINRPGWVSGNAITLYFNPEGSIASANNLSTFEHGAGHTTPQLILSTGSPTADNPTEQLQATDLLDFEEI